MGWDGSKLLLCHLSNAFFLRTRVTQTGRAVTSIHAEEMSKSIPFLVRPEKLDGTVPGDMGFDPMRLSDIQTDLNYARWAEVKHGRICMLAIVGIIVQQAGIHFPGEAYTNTDIFGAISSVGWAANIQILCAIAIVEGSTFYKHYSDDSTPGDIGWGNKVLYDLSPEQQKVRLEQEIIHGRLAMIAFVGAVVQTLVVGNVV
jgi:light-harvesting complex I chlorophyll a/b binding protein 1